MDFSFPALGIFMYQTPQDDLSSFRVFCEIVASDSKPLALSYPMETIIVDTLWGEFMKTAEKYNVQIHKEDDLPRSLLFADELTTGKTVILIYKGDRLTQYQQWRADAKASQAKDFETLIALARRFGRLLGYSTQGINQLLSDNSNYRSLASFQVKNQITHLYYSDLGRAMDFYSNTLGLPKLSDSRFQVSADAFIQLHEQNEAHPKGQAKSTAIAFLTDQLQEWYAHVQKSNIPIKYTYKPKEGGPHDGFVAIDPGGYLLEFEQFKQHPENELFMAVLKSASRLETGIARLNFYGTITWTYHGDLLLMQRFYEEELGLRLVADQGWTKIYRTSPTGFIGLEDERRGMEDYAETKAVEIQWAISDLEAFDAYASEFWQKRNYANGSLIGPEGYKYMVSEPSK